jgi:hypothetical protein
MEGLSALSVPKEPDADKRPVRKRVSSETDKTTIAARNNGAPWTALHKERGLKLADSEDVKAHDAGLGLCER